MKNITHVAIYIRVSTDEQAKEGLSIPTQKKNLIDYCKEKKYKYECFIDDGFTATNMKRPALLELLKRLNEFDMILFTKLDRLSRNVLDANNLVAEFDKYDVSIMSLLEDEIDTTTADGKFMFNLQVSLAERESKKTSERIKDIFNYKRKIGQVTSGKKIYGYDIVDKKYVINQEEAEEIRDIFNYVLKTGSFVKTYDYWTAKYNKSICYDYFRTYFRNTAYIGKYKTIHEEIIENYTPAIIDAEIFEKVQLLIPKSLRKSRADDNFNEYLFAGLLYCEECGKKMSKRRYRKQRKDGSMYQRILYTCYNRTQRKCSSHRDISESNIENYLLNHFKTLVENYIITNKIVSEKITNESKNNEKTKKQITLLKKKITKSKDLYYSDLIDKEEYEMDFKKFKEEIDILEKSLDVVPVKKDLSHLRKLLDSDLNTIYYSLSFENKRRFWITIIDKIYIEEGEIKEVIFL